MRFIDDKALDELAKSSTILQCMVHLLDFECNKYHFQPELIGAEDNVAMINCDPMTEVEIFNVCQVVNSHFKRVDKRLSCVLYDFSKTLVVCEASDLSAYSQLA